MRILLTIPAVPGSINHLYGQTKYGRRYLTKKGQEFKDTVHKAIDEQIQNITEEFFLGRLNMDVYIYFGDKRKRDLDNCMKILFDSLQHQLFNDDCQLDYYSVTRLESLTNPRVEIEMWDNNG